MTAGQRADGRRVVVTGMGAVTSLGTGILDFADSLRAGRSGIGPLTAFDAAGFAHANVGEVGGFEAADWFRRADPQEYGRAAQFTVAATRQAVQDAGLEEDVLRERRVLVSIGTTDGGTRELDRLAELRFTGGQIRPDPKIARLTRAERISDAVVDELALEDVESVTVPVACAAGNYAVGQGLDALRTGEAELALCGGADALTRKTFAGFYRLGAMAPDVCRPFDTDRAGMLVGEGAGMLVLETLDSALARGARIHAEILGYGLSCDASHPVAPDRDGVARAVSAAHRDAGVTGAQIDYICAHGTGTKANDKVEAAALRDVFRPGPPADRRDQVDARTQYGGRQRAGSHRLRPRHEPPLPAADREPPGDRPGVRRRLRAQHLGGRRAADHPEQRNGFRGQQRRTGPGPLRRPGIHGRTAGGGVTTHTTALPVITAWSALSPWGEGADAFREGLAGDREAVTTVDSAFWPGTPVRAGVVPGIRIEYEGTRGVRSLDRLTRLTLLLSGMLLDDQGGSTGAEPEDTGMVFATSGSVKSCLDFTTSTYTGAKPFHVDPSRFPSTAANCAASRSAIWYGFKGPSTTLTGGTVGGLLALAQAGRLLRQGRAEVLLAGAGEEYTEDRVLLEEALYTGEGQAPPLAEGGALFLLETAEGAAARGRTPLAVLRGSRFRAYHPERGGSAEQALLACVTSLLEESGTDAADIGLTVGSDPSGTLGEAEDTALAAVFARTGAGAKPRRIALRHRIGHGGSAAPAFQTAAALCADGEGPLRAPVLVTSVEDGRVGAVLLGRPAG